MLPLTLAAALLASPARAHAEPVPEWQPSPALSYRRWQDPVEALGTDGPYFQINGGFTTTTESEGPLEGDPGEEIDFDEGWLAALALGTRFGAEDGNALAFDVELEGLYSDSDVDDDGVLTSPEDVTLAAGLVNGMLDLRLAERFSLYGGGGVGLGWLSIGDSDDTDFDEEDGPFLTWQAKAGLRFWASEQVSLQLGYRFLNVEDVEVDTSDESTFDLETQQHVVEVGVRFQM